MVMVRRGRGAISSRVALVSWTVAKGRLAGDESGGKLTAAENQAIWWGVVLMGVVFLSLVTQSGVIFA